MENGYVENYFIITEGGYTTVTLLSSLKTWQSIDIDEDYIEEVVEFIEANQKTKDYNYIFNGILALDFTIAEEVAI